MRTCRRDDRGVNPLRVELSRVELTEQALHPAIPERLADGVAALDQAIRVPDQEVAREQRSGRDLGDQCVTRAQRVAARDQRRQVDAVGTVADEVGREMTGARELDLTPGR